jgi:hypothetical protein
MTTDHFFENGRPVHPDLSDLRAPTDGKAAPPDCLEVEEINAV